MDERKPPHAKDDDVPIIGDYSKGPNAPSRAPPRAQPPPSSAPRAPSRATAEQWRVDPSDVRRHAKLRRQRERVGPLGKILRYAGVALVLAAGLALYLNFDSLREASVDLSALTSLFGDDSGGGDGETRPFGGEPESAVVEAPGVVGANVPTSIGAPPPEAETPVAEVPANAAPLLGGQSPIAAAGSPAAEPEPPPAAAPEPPPGPETFDFGLDVINVSEKDASAAVIILRHGGRRGPSSVTWWTTDGTATAGVDYANLGKVDVSFVAGEQNHTIHIPIVGDRTVEGLETFYVNVAPGANAAEPTARLEVVINDDD